MEVDSSIDILSPSLTTHAIATKLDLQLNLTDNTAVERVDAEINQINPQPEEEDEIEEEQEEEGDCDFSFVCAESFSPISADDLFDNGQIKPIFPWLGNANLGDEEEARLMSIPVNKVFGDRSDLPSAEDVAEGPYCAWSKRTESAGESTSSVPESCRKSNSTGFSKLRRFRDLLHRSQSDGKDTFVFLTTEKRGDKDETTSLPPSSKKGSSRKGKKEAASGETKTTSSTKSKTTSSLSSYALQYGKNGEKGKEKRKSYLPYRQDLVGFFTNANAISKNIHPY